MEGRYGGNHHNRRQAGDLARKRDGESARAGSTGPVFSLRRRSPALLCPTTAVQKGQPPASSNPIEMTLSSMPRRAS